MLDWKLRGGSRVNQQPHIGNRSNPDQIDLTGCTKYGLRRMNLAPSSNKHGLLGVTALDRKNRYEIVGTSEGQGDTMVRNFAVTDSIYAVHQSL
jgi:hypothetical protein